MFVGMCQSLGRRFGPETSDGTLTSVCACVCVCVCVVACVRLRVLVVSVSVCGWARGSEG